jgi:hypothetical protein
MKPENTADQYYDYYHTVYTVEVIPREQYWLAVLKVTVGTILVLYVLFGTSGVT